jgi:hypothetical protein
MFTVSCTSDKIWNITELVGYLAANQHQSVTLDINPEAICLTNLGLYNLLDKFTFKDVCVRTWNPLETHDCYTIQVKSDNFWFKRTASIDPSLHTWNLARRFLCLYHRPTAGRLGIASHLYNNHNDQSLIHFSTTDLFDFELDKLLQWDVNSAADAASLLPVLPLLLGNSDGYTSTNGYYYTDPLTNLYRDILIDVVVESHVTGNTFFPTEKTVRPMLLKKPFILFGSRDYFDYLRQMGFKTFGDFWNEDYDGYEDKDRLLKILKLLDNLAQKPVTELQTMYKDMQGILDHNYNLLMSQSYKTQITKIT